MTFSRSSTADGNCRGSYGERIGDGGRREPWVFSLGSKAHASRKQRGRRGYQNRIFAGVAHAPIWRATAHENGVRSSAFRRRRLKPELLTKGIFIGGSRVLTSQIPRRNNNR
jgi:hypothetical protein